MPDLLRVDVTTLMSLLVAVLRRYSNRGQDPRLRKHELLLLCPIQ